MSVQLRPVGADELLEGGLAAHGAEDYEVELAGLEPATSWVRSRRSPKLSYSPALSARGRC
jgi:hypothetical protein